MLTQLYENIKKFVRLTYEVKSNSCANSERLDRLQTKRILLHQSASIEDENEKVINEILVKTLSRLAIINIDLRNYSGAHQAV